MDKQLLEDVVEVRRKGDRILLVKLILGREIFNVFHLLAVWLYVKRKWNF